MDAVGLTGVWDAARQQFFLGTEDGTFYLHPAVYFQFRGIVNDREQFKKHHTDDTQMGFEVRRLKFAFDGNLFTPDLTYKFQWQDSIAGAPTLEYGWVQYVLLKRIGGTGDVAIRAGQFKDIVFKEEFTGDPFQLLVERSLANVLVGGNAPLSNLTQGVDFMWLGKESPLHAELLIHNGFGSALTAFTQPRGTAVVFPQVPANPPTNPSFGGATARVDYKVFGDWADTTDFTGMNSGKKDLLDLGAGVDYTSAQGEEALRYTVDAQYQIAKKLSIFAAGFGDNFMFRSVKSPKTTPHILNNFGAMIEGGYLITPAWQLVGRYTIVRLDPKVKPAGFTFSTFQEISAGLNWYGPNGSWGNHLKLTVDLNYLPDGTPAFGGLEYLASTGRHDEIVLRSQLQLWF
jgi:hypothetical protein